MQKPLAEILRPRTLDSYVGQDHLMGEGAVLRNAIEQDNIQSMIFWGPPGVGKTTLALLIAELTHSEFFMLSAISSGVKDIRDVIEKAKKTEHRCLLFIDEIHRLNRQVEEVLYPAMEDFVLDIIVEMYFGNAFCFNLIPVKDGCCNVYLGLVDSDV